MTARMTASAVLDRARPGGAGEPTEASAAHWFYRPLTRARPARRLYCFPYAGGGATVYRSWAARLPPDIELVAIQLPGRGGRIREAPIADIPELACAAADAISRHGDVPFGLFGHSMGALLAFEVTRRLRSRGAPEPCHLFVSGCRAPHLAGGRSPVAATSDAEFLERLRRLNGTPESVLREPELMALMLPVLRADFTAVDRWTLRPEPPLQVPITAIGGHGDPHVPLQAVRAWGAHTRGPFRCRTFDGDHFFLVPQELALVNLVADSLAADTWV